MKNALTLIFLLTLSVIFCDAKNEVSFLDSLDTGYELIDSDLSRAQKLGEFCEKYSFEQNDSLKWAKSLNLLTIIYKRQAKFSESIKVGIQSFEIYKKIGSKQGELNTLNSVALTYCNTGEYSKIV